MAANRLDHVVRLAGFKQFRNDSVTKVVEPQANQTRSVTKRTPGRVPFAGGFRRVEAVPLAGGPQVVVWLGVSERIRPSKHPFDRRLRRRVEWKDTVTRLVLALADVNHALLDINIAAPEVFDLDAAH